MDTDTDMIKFEKIRTPEYLRDTKVDPMYHLEYGDNLFFSEKIDGTNAQVRLIDGELVCYSHNKQLDGSKDGTLNGFTDMVSNNQEAIKKTLEGHNYALFGEWLIPHKVKYNPSAYNKWYLFDIYDIDHNTYLGLVDTVDIISSSPLKDLEDIKIVPYSGKISDTEVIMKANYPKFDMVTSFDYSIKEILANIDEWCKESVLQDELPEEERMGAEGLVVTDYSKFITTTHGSTTNRYLREKFVTSKFKESKGLKYGSNVKPSNAKEVALKLFIYDMITIPRIRKKWYEWQEENDKVGSEITRSVFKGTNREIAHKVLDDAIEEYPVSDEYSLKVQYLWANDEKFYKKALDKTLMQVNKFFGLSLKGEL